MVNLALADTSTLREALISVIGVNPFDPVRNAAPIGLRPRRPVTPPPPSGMNREARVEDRSFNETLPPEPPRGNFDPRRRGKKPAVDCCIACQDDAGKADDLVKVPCGCLYCATCLTSLFELAIKDETMWPPSCCIARIPIKLVRPYLSKELVREFEEKQLERSVKDKTYCHQPACSKFILPHSIHNGQAICQKCNAKTCTKCKAEWHFGPCSKQEDAALMALAQTERWKPCPECHRLVERADGCSHIVCRCGHEFCHLCGIDIDDCICDGSDDLETMHLLQGHSDYRVRKQEGTVFECEFCYGVFKDWINRCIDCDLHVCNRCRRGQQERLRRREVMEQDGGQFPVADFGSQQ